MKDLHTSAAVEPPSLGPSYHRGWRRRSIFGALGLRGPISEHTTGEAALLRRHAEGASCVVEIGVAEGGSAVELRAAMKPAGILALVDPYPAGRLFGLNMAQVVAHRAVARVPGARVEWMRMRGDEACLAWSQPIDLIFLDGDHAFAAVRADWEGWSPHVRPGGIVMLHDARVIPGGRVSPQAGPARFTAELREKSQDWSVVDEADSILAFRRNV